MARLVHRSPSEASNPNPLAIAQARGRWALVGKCFFASARRGAVGPDVRSVDVELRPVDVALRVELEVQSIEDALEQAFARPPSVAIVNAGPLAVAFGQVAPRRRAVEDPEDAVERGAVVVPSPAGA